MPIIQIVAFRGTGGVVSREHPYFGKEAGLVRAGHVGIKGVFPDKIIGFSPTPEAVASIGDEQKLLDILVKHQTFPGCLQDDTRHFKRAYALIPETKERTTVWEINVEISEETLNTIKEWYNEKYTSLYKLPEEQPPEFNPGEANCATFLSTVLGIPAIAETGSVSTFIMAMRIKGATKWQPNL